MGTTTGRRAARAGAAWLWIFHIFLTGQARMVVEDSLKGAARRLGNPACQEVLGDFSDSAGRPLSAALAASGQTPGDFLNALYFVEGDPTPQCRSDETTAAFTVPNSRVVHVCGTRFAANFARKTGRGEIVIIHELLHALGLGENPPTSAFITDAVIKRCR